MSRSVCIQGHLIYIHSQLKVLSEAFPSIEPSLLQKCRFEWMLVPTVDNTAQLPILLSIPQSYSRQAAAFESDDRAARTVQVSGELFQLLEDDGDVSLFLEVSILRIPSPAERSTQSPHNIYTLSQAARLETADRREKKFSLSGVTVAAVSPVLAMDRDDPFCLVDIVDGDLSAVVVLRGNSLRLQRGLVPHHQGSVVTFYGLRKQRWRMRESGIGESPAAVFVADAASSITWEMLGNETDDSTTVLRGTIESVHLAMVGTTKKRLNYLEVRLNEGIATTATVYMTHFPLSMADMLSLRPGSHVEMRNIYKLGDPMTFAACLRSGLSIVEFSTTDRPDISTSEISSFAWYKQIKPTYPSLYAKRSVAKFVERNEHVRSSFGVEDMRQSLVPKKKVCTRNAYMEFLALDDTASESPETACPDSVLPSLVGVSEIVNQSFAWLVERLRVDVAVGWRTELHIQADAFLPDCRSICTFGRTTSIEEKHQSLFLTLSDGCFDIPVVSNSMNATALRVDSSVWLRITHIYVSCICICDESERDVAHNRGPESYKQLPLFDSRNRDHVAIRGCCRVLSSGRSVYVASIYAIAEGTYPSKSSDSLVDSNQPIRSTVGVMDCLANLQDVDKQRQYIECLLLRSRFKIIKIKTAGYGGCTLSLGHVPAGDEEAATLQRVELKPTVSLENKNYSVIKNALRSFCRDDSLSHERLSLCLVWWRIASDPKTCSLLLSGWETDNETAHHETPDTRVLVWIPGSALQLDPKRGYCRLRSTMNDLIAVTVPPRVKLDQNGTPFHFVINQSHPLVTGMLDRRAPRVGGGRYGELRVHSRLAGLPIMTLREILLDLAKDLSNQTRCNLRPSLVRQVHCEAALLGVSYCQAQAECSNCYGALIDARGQTVCTNGCKNEGKGIKWECSGLLDDGTGQAKLYAEREAALLLLGLSESTIALIEQGVWAIKTKSIVFSKPMPPKRYLGRSVESARSMATACRRMQNRHWNGKLSETEVLRHMPPSTRAEYLLEWHCRYSHQPCRKLRYFVRCKPVADGVMHLMQTEIDLPHETNRVSYSFPPIKLILVDCAQPMEFPLD